MNIREFLSDEQIKNLSLSERMKWFEGQPITVLDENAPAIIRIDGKAFHTYCKGFEKPFDQNIIEAMMYATQKLCAEIQNVRVGYSQSDEISILMTTHESDDKQPWFGGKVSKIVSVAASIATVHFNEYMDKNHWAPKVLASEVVGEAPPKKKAMFDARVFNIPLDEVNNCMIWRQQDAIRNSVSALAQSRFSHKQLHGVNVENMKKMLMEKENIDWNELPVNLQRGFCVNRVVYDKDGTPRSRWDVDRSIPEFTVERDYIDRYVRQIA